MSDPPPGPDWAEMSEKMSERMKGFWIGMVIMGIGSPVLQWLIMRDWG